MMIKFTMVIYTDGAFTCHLIEGCTKSAPEPVLRHSVLVYEVVSTRGVRLITTFSYGCQHTNPHTCTLSARCLCSE